MLQHHHVPRNFAALNLFIEQAGKKFSRRRRLLVFDYLRRNIMNEC